MALGEPLGSVVAQRVEYANKCPRKVLGFESGQGLHHCVAAHAERNALLQAAKLGIATKGSTLYCFCGVPCKDCAIEIVNAGVTEVVCIKWDYKYDQLNDEVFRLCGVTVREVEWDEEVS
jgi:dCMP deaminase